MSGAALPPSRRGALGLLAGAAVAMPAIAGTRKLDWVGASAVPPADFIARSIDFFAARLGELSAGQMVLTNRHEGALGSEREQIEALLRDTVHFATPGLGLLAGWYRPAEVWIHPYLFRDIAHKDRVWDTVRAEYTAELARAAKLRILAAIPRMPRQLACNRAVGVPADLKGLKIRVPEAGLWRRAFEMLGAAPVPLPFPQVLQALTSGKVDGQENPVALAWNSGLLEASSHLALTGHMMQDNCILMAEAAYAGLTEDQRRIVDQAARDMEAEMRPRVVADDAVVMDRIRARRIAVSEVDKPAFAAAVKSLGEEFPAGRTWAERFARIA